MDKPPFLTGAKIDVRRYRISTLSPVHISGSDGSVDYGQSFFRKKGDNNYIYLLDTPKFQKYLYVNHGGLDAVKRFADWIENDRNTKKGITGFLQSIGFDFNNSHKVSKGKVHAQVKDRGPTRFIRNGINRAYIPGSSIKGAIRTAVLWKILKDMRAKKSQEFDREMASFVEKHYLEFQKDGRKPKFKETFSEGLVDRLFQGFLLKSPRMTKEHAIDKKSPFTDIFKAIKIKDSTPIEEKALSEKRWDVLSLRGNPLAPYVKFPDKYFRLEAYLAAEKDKSVLFEVLVDMELLENFRESKRQPGFWSDYLIPFKNVDELMKIVFSFSSAIWRELESYYAKWPKNNCSKNIYDFYHNGVPETAMRVGWGTGLLGTTMALILKENPDLTIDKPANSGKIFKYFADKGFGFIKFGKKEIFFHKSAAPHEDQNNISVGASVSFVSGTGRNGRPAATSVQISSSTSPPLRPRHILEQLRDDVIHGRQNNFGTHVPKSAKVIRNASGKPKTPLGWITLEEA